MLLRFLREASPQFAVAVFDAPGATFRDALFAEYKANRPPPPDELVSQLPVIRRVVPALGLPLREEPEVEADDVIGTLARQAVSEGTDVVVVTGDKDMMQLVDEHVTLWDTMRERRTGLDDIRGRLGLEPAQLVDVMALMGDSSDNIPGVTGIGEKTATALIRHFGGLESVLANPQAVRTAGIRGAAKLAATLAREMDVARLSRQLATIRCDLPLVFSLEECCWRGLDYGVLRPLVAELEFSSLLRQHSPEPQSLVVASTVVRTTQAIAGLVEQAAARRRVALAATWSSPRPMEADLTGLALAIGEEEVAAVDVAGASGTAEVMSRLRPLFESETVEKIGENLKSLMVLAGRHQIEMCGGLFDTMVASYVLDPTREGHGLQSLAERFLGAAPGAGGPEEMPAAAVAALRLVPVLEERLSADDALTLFRDVEMPLVGVLAQMERHGVFVDTTSLQALSAEYATRLRELVAEIYDLAGGEFNIQSPPQLRAVLFDRLRLPARGVRRGKTGLSTDVDVLTRLAGEHPLPGKILEYRALSKLKSTYVDALPALVNRETGRIHTSFHQAVTATGRLSSSDPNLQNIPARGEEGRRIRAAFAAPPGRVMLSADYSQIELRILAHLSGDPTLAEAFQRGEDIHARTAAEVFGGLAGVSEDMRRAAKVINFGIIYGMGRARLARELEVSQDEAARYIERYFARYAGVQCYVDRTVAEARARGYVVTLLNRRRYLPELSARQGAAAQFAERVAVNTPIQGSAADLIKVAMLHVDARLRQSGLDARMVLQVHDELVFEVAREAVGPVGEVVRAEMEGVADLCVPLRVELRAGQNWAEAH
jgi:DNA polymerase-1